MTSARKYVPNEYDESVRCPNCDPDEADVLFELHGVFGGGGPGKYTMCENCGMVLTKTCDSDKEPKDARAK